MLTQQLLATPFLEQPTLRALPLALPYPFLLASSAPIRVVQTPPYFSRGYIKSRFSPSRLVPPFRQPLLPFLGGVVLSPSVGVTPRPLSLQLLLLPASVGPPFQHAVGGILPSWKFLGISSRGPAFPIGLGRPTLMLR